MLLLTSIFLFLRCELLHFLTSRNMSECSLFEAVASTAGEEGEKEYMCEEGGMNEWVNYCRQFI